VDKDDNRALKGYRIVSSNGDGKASSLGNDAEIVSLERKIHTFKTPFLIGTKREYYDYIDGLPDKQLLLTYKFFPSDTEKKMNADGEVLVSKAELIGIQSLGNADADDVPLDLKTECRCHTSPFGELLQEKLSFDQFLRVSDPARLMRSETVRGPSLDLDAVADGMYYYFNFKSFPSTTGLRHRGYIRFLKPYGVIRSDDHRKLEHIKCIVDCTCPDYRYRWAWANKQKGSCKVGPGTLNLCLNRAPRKTNPTGRPGLCKHLLALRDYIYGQTTNFAGKGDSYTKKLDKLVKYAHKRWINFPSELAKGKAKEKGYLDRVQRLRVGDDGIPRPGVEPVLPQRDKDVEIPEPAQLNPDDPVTTSPLPSNPADAVPPEIPSSPLGRMVSNIQDQNNEGSTNSNQRNESVSNKEKHMTLNEAKNFIATLENENPEGEDEALQLLRTIASGIEQLNATMTSSEVKDDEALPPGEDELPPKEPESDVAGDEDDEDGGVPPIPSEDQDDIPDEAPEPPKMKESKEEKKFPAFLKKKNDKKDGDKEEEDKKDEKVAESKADQIVDKLLN